MNRRFFPLFLIDNKENFQNGSRDLFELLRRTQMHNEPANIVDVLSDERFRAPVTFVT